MWKKRWAMRFERAVELARQERRKLAIVSGAGLLLLSLAFRFLFRGPIAAPAAIFTSPASDSRIVESTADAPPSSSKAMNEWLNEPKQPVKRNAFALNLEDYPTDASLTATAAPNRFSTDQKDQSLWDDVAKSLSAQADHKREQELRLKNLQQAAAKIAPQQIIIGPPPKAQVNGELIEEGGFIGPFRVLRIASDRITVEKDGITLDVPMH
jgi:hypothetical protein